MERKRDADRSLIFSYSTKNRHMPVSCFLSRCPRDGAPLSHSSFHSSLRTHGSQHSLHFVTFTALLHRGTDVPLTPLLFDPSRGTKKQACARFLFFIMVPSRGIEPRFQTPQACVLSIERRGQLNYPSLRTKDSTSCPLECSIYWSS